MEPNHKIRVLQALQKASNHYGSYSSLAKSLGIERQNIHHWIKNGVVPPKQAIRIEQQSGGVVTVNDLCPELYS